MGSILAVVSLAHTNGLPADACQNQFAVETAGAASGADHVGIASEIGDFYSGLATGAAAEVGAYLSPVISRVANAHSVALYNLDGHLDGSPHGSPMFENTFTIDAPLSTSPYPEEVACVLTLRGLDWSMQPVESPDSADEGTERDRPRQRHTGRVYIGPVNANAAMNDNGVNRPAVQFRNDLRFAAAELQSSLIAETASYLAVWSRKNSALYRVTHVQVDDAWDTQRRRGAKAVSRQQTTVYTP